METTFISIHDLSLDARMLYVSTSIEDILGYSPQDVIGKSCWDFFHPDEIPFAQSIHGRSIQLDKAAVLNYCQIKNKHGRWVGCECVFTIVHDVLVASTSVYRCGPGSQRRAIEAPVIRQLFSSTPRDPRYHMLSYISSKFSQEPVPHANEPRAALFLNRFSRTLAIMYATDGLADVLGINASQLIGKSFYFCIQENCLREAVKCLESAKANDSIAYLRFWFRDPTQDNDPDRDERMSDGHSSADDDDGGVHLSELMDQDGEESGYLGASARSERSSTEPRTDRYRSGVSNSRSSSGNSTDLDGTVNDPLFDQPAGNQSTTSSISTPDESQSQRSSEPPMVELEAVVSCTSDGLVVVLRAARPLVPNLSQVSAEPVKHPYANGFFASPWAQKPIIPNLHQRSDVKPSFAQTSSVPVQPTAAQAHIAANTGATNDYFMNSIREVAVFAWSLIGINGSLVKHSRGTPSGQSQPQNGLPVWDPYANAGLEPSSDSQSTRNQYRYSPDDGAPIYDQMQIDGDFTNSRQNADSASRNFSLPALMSNGYTNAASEPQANGMHRPERGSSLKNSVSVNDLAPNHLNQNVTNAPPNLAAGLNGIRDGNTKRHTPNFSLPGPYDMNTNHPVTQDDASNSVPSTQDVQMEYDPYAPGVYPVSDPAKAVNGTSMQTGNLFGQSHSQTQDGAYENEWNANTSQRQHMTGFSTYS